jgi:putative membrane protein
MAESGSMLKYGRMFQKGLPTAKLLFTVLVAVSIAFGIASVALAHYTMLPAELPYTIISGFIVGIIAITVPTLITTIFVKIFTRKVAMKHLLFIAFSAALAFSAYLLISSLLYIVFGTAIAVIMVVVGAASIFGWWFFAGKMVFLRSSMSLPVALIQPTLYVLFYIPTSRFIFAESIPTNVLLIKLYLGTFVFAVVIYSIMYLFDKPLKKTLRFAGIGSFSAMLQDWLFGISTYKAFNERYGYATNVSVDTMVFSNGKPSGILFMPNIHYGLFGSIGGSNFPYLIERHGRARHKAATFVMHTAINEDFNPISASQISKLEGALDGSLLKRNAKSEPMEFSYSEHGHSKVTQISFGKSAIVILTRAPEVTEDVAPEVSILFRKLLESSTGKRIVLIDAHNSRYETASKDDLAGVRMDTRHMDDYLEAIKGLRPRHRSRRTKAGFAAVELYNRLGAPKDLAKGNLNIAVFRFNSFSYAMLQFNCNNMLPSLRDSIRNHISKRYGISSEVLTTDTHAVNSIGTPASNVLGRHAKFSNLKGPIDECMASALADVKDVRVSHSSTELKNFMIWGYNSRERIFTVLNSISSLGRVMVPVLVAIGFVAAAWLIYVI